MGGGAAGVSLCYLGESEGAVGLPGSAIDVNAEDFKDKDLFMHNVSHLIVTDGIVSFQLLFISISDQQGPPEGRLAPAIR